MELQAIVFLGLLLNCWDRSLFNIYEAGVDENDGQDRADYDNDEMVPMVIVASVVGMVMFKSVQFFYEYLLGKVRSWGNQ